MSNRCECVRWAGIGGSICTTGVNVYAGQVQAGQCVQYCRCDSVRWAGTGRSMCTTGVNVYAGQVEAGQCVQQV